MAQVYKHCCVKTNSVGKQFFFATHPYYLNCLTIIVYFSVCPSVKCLNGGILDVNTCTCDCPNPFTGWTCAGNISACFIGRMLDIHTCTCDCPNTFTGWTCAGNILECLIVRITGINTFTLDSPGSFA